MFHLVLPSEPMNPPPSPCCLVLCHASQVTHKDSLNQITELCGAAVTTKGQYFRPGAPAPAGERKLYLLIEGPTESSVKRAKVEIKRILEECTEKVTKRSIIPELGFRVRVSLSPSSLPFLLFLSSFGIRRKRLFPRASPSAFAPAALEAAALIDAPW